MNRVKNEEVRAWLKTCFEKSLQSFQFQITGQTEKGSGYASDVLFVQLTGIDKQGAKKNLDLVLKCDKLGVLTEKSTTFEEIYAREVILYEKIFPYFQQFQREKGVECPFDSTPRCYGVYGGSRFIIVMDNLKKLGYDLNDFKKPLTRKHISLVVIEYAKFHAISVALKEQRPEEFQRLVQDFRTDPLSDLNRAGYASVLQKIACEVQELIKDELAEQTVSKWMNFKDKVPLVLDEVSTNDDVFQVLVHGDCWNNNFMFKYQNNDNSIVSEVAILDWQTARISSPILDLSYFLFACINPKDIVDLKIILKEYYNELCHSLSEMSTTFQETFTFETFYQEWKKRAKFGIMMCLLPIKVSYAEKQEMPDVAENAAREGVGASFNFSIKNTNGFKHRMLPIIKYAVETEII